MFSFPRARPGPRAAAAPAPPRPAGSPQRRAPPHRLRARPHSGPTAAARPALRRGARRLAQPRPLQEGRETRDGGATAHAHPVPASPPLQARGWPGWGLAPAQCGSTAREGRGAGGGGRRGPCHPRAPLRAPSPSRRRRSLPGLARPGAVPRGPLRLGPRREEAGRRRLPGKRRAPAKPGPVPTPARPPGGRRRPRRPWQGLCPGLSPLTSLPPAAAPHRRGEPLPAPGIGLLHIAAAPCAPRGLRPRCHPRRAARPLSRPRR